MDFDMHKLIQLITKPDVAVPMWGAVGGIITALFRRRHTFCSVLGSIALAALFANWFTFPIVEYFGLPASACGGVGGVLGIASYEIARVIATSNFYKLLAHVMGRK